MKVSVRWKIISVVLLIIVFGLGAVASSTFLSINAKTKRSVIINSEVITNQMSNHILTFLNEYEKSLLKMTTQQDVIDYFNNSKQYNDKADQVFRTQLKNYLSVYKDASAIYFADGKKLIIEPHYNEVFNLDVSSRNWYTEALKNPDKVVWTDLYVDDRTGQFTISGSKAVILNGHAIGVLGVDIKLDRLTEIISSTALNYKGYPMVIDSNGTAIVHPTKMGEDLSGLDYIKKILNDNESLNSLTTENK